MVENGGFRRAGCRSVVVARDRVEELGEHCGIEVACAFLDHAEPEVDVTEQTPLLGLAEARARPELADAPDVVQERGRQDDVGAKPGVELRRLAAQRRDADGVLEETARVPVMAVGAGGRKRAETRSDLRVAEECVDDGSKPVVGDLRRQELEEAVELVRIASHRRRQLGRVGVCRLDGAHLYLQLPAEALDAAEDADGVALVEARVEQLDVAPHARLDATARIDELECEVWSTRAGAASLFPCDREHALDGPVLDELGDRGHVPSLRSKAVGTLARYMADVQPFRAVRYSGAAGALADLVAPPYDAVDDAERAALYTRSPYNVVHVTLPESPETAARLYGEWLADGILHREDDEAAWLGVEDYVGPDGVARRRRGVIVSVLAEPYEAGSVLPHERTHERIRRDRLALLRATRVQPEPILLLTESPLALEMPERQPDLEVEGTRLWRVHPTTAYDVETLLIADGHHRYEAAVELGAEVGSPLRIMALVVPTDDPGVQVFPTHRVFSDRADLLELDEGELCADLAEASIALGDEGYEAAAVVAYRRGAVSLVRGAVGEPDTDLVDRHGLEGIRYTPRAEEALAAVDRGDADVAYLMRTPRIEDIFRAAREGVRMPPKTTYFQPKPVSGLVFHPVGP